MSIGRTILMRMFGHPRGLLGRPGGVILARTGRRHAAWVVNLVAVRREDGVLAPSSQDRPIMFMDLA